MSQAGGFQNVSEGGGVVQFTVDAATGTGNTTVTPLSGNVRVSADIVTQQGICIRTQSPALHQYNVEVQYCDVNASALANKSGMAHFNSAQFSVDNTTGFVSIIGGGFQWNIVTSATNPNGVSAENGYISKGAGAVTFVLPPSASVGAQFVIAGYGNLWTLTQNAGQSVTLGETTTTVGVDGSITATQIRDTITVVCVTENTEFQVLNSVGNLSIV